VPSPSRQVLVGSLLAIALARAGLATAPNADPTFTTISVSVGSQWTLVKDPSGALYGVTDTSIFQLAPPSETGGAWMKTVLYTFDDEQVGPVFPDGLVRDPRGNLYGVTNFGGTVNEACSKGCGVVFQLAPPAGSGGAWTENVLYAFAGASDGAEPAFGLVLGKRGELYGSADAGGNLAQCPGPSGNYSGCGVVFQLIPPVAGGGWSYNVLYAFSGGSDGAGPGLLTMDESGTVYGTTEGGSSAGIGYGTVFALAPPATAGGTWTKTVLHAFAGPPSEGTDPIGVVIGSGGLLYGTTAGGGTSGNGTVFELSPATAGGPWSFATLFSFDRRDGSLPVSPLTLSKAGDLYGTTYGGGKHGFGIIFSLTPPSAAGAPWTERTLYNFVGGSGGSEPSAGLLLGKGRVAYGATSGTVFQLTW